MTLPDRLVPARDPAETAALIRRQRIAGLKLAARGATEVGTSSEFDRWLADFKTWRRATVEMLRGAFEGDGPAREFYEAVRQNFAVSRTMTVTQLLARHSRNLTRGMHALAALEGALGFSTAPKPDAALAEDPGAAQVFIVHGRDEGVRAQVEALLRRFGIDPVILEDRANQGMSTIVEKLEREAAPVGYAIVILAPEDWRRDVDRADWPEQPNSARENVMLELGYFLGVLGRDRVTALYLKGTELPSDVGGALWTPIDEHGAWRYKLARELRAAGFDVDSNSL